ncbi:hypothetical protein BG61_04205 [Caballeronia glathei]|uniref:Uncharacterized protein n=1 Tax=Caballeronia glathei TaxID=60547 RepID=A0A069PC71_9BURK|nr:hypothetical protein BG61_04205 [Caballeronia glathei]
MLRQLFESSMQWIKSVSIQQFQIAPGARPLALQYCSLQGNAEVLLVMGCSVFTVATGAMGEPTPRTHFVTK